MNHHRDAHGHDTTAPHSTPPRATPHMVAPHIVRAAIAKALAAHQSTASSPTLGHITLLPHQIDAVGRLRIILHTEHVALLADDVGMGKTFTALAVARHYPRVHIIAPATLLPMWRAAVADAGITSAHIESLHRYSIRATPAETLPPGTLVVVDEAHHLRSPNTNRYRAIATVCAGRDLLLLTATPVHNRPGDLTALLALALGARANLGPGLLGRVVVRRTRHHDIPAIRQHPPVVVPHDPALLEQILALPAPLPAHDGAVAGALVRLGLLRAWCSSDAALETTLRRRLLRGEALRHALQAGRHPTSAELRTWIVGEHDVQLAFPELLAAHAPETGPLLDVLTRHLDAVRRLQATVQRAHHGDLARARALKSLLDQYPDRPIVAFSQFAETVRAIRRALCDIAGVGALSGRGGWIASGPVTRQHVLAHFAPLGQGRPPPPAHQRIRLLITTDLLAEGVNLQDAGVVVHLDLPWTNALRQQRVGRTTRIGAVFPTVEVYRFRPPPGAAKALRLLQRLRRKAKLATALVGAPTPRHSLRGAVRSAVRGAVRSTVRGSASSAADATTALHALLQQWHSENASIGPSEIAGDPAAPLVALLPSRVTAALVVLRDPDGRAVLCSLQQRTIHGVLRWTVSRTSRRIARVARRAHRAPDRVFDGARDPSLTARGRAVWSRVTRVLHQWQAREALRGDIGERDPVMLPVQGRVDAQLRARMERLPVSRRTARRVEFQRASRVVRAAHGAAAESALLAWLGSSREDASAWESRWREYPVLVAADGSGESPGELTAALSDRPQIVAALLLVAHRVS